MWPSARSNRRYDIFEGLTTTWNDAVKLIRQGGIEFASNHDHDAVGPMAGVISPSLPILVVKDQSNGILYCPICRKQSPIRTVR